MHIGHCLASIDVDSGGPARSVPALCKATARLVDRVTLFTLRSRNPIPASQVGRGNLEMMPPGIPSPLCSSAALQRVLNHARVDVFHGHGLWQMPVHYMMSAAVRRGIPTLIAPRGMLEPNALNFSRAKKRLAGWLFQNRDLHRAWCLHATSDMEAENCRKYGLRNPIAVIPNGLDLQEYVIPQSSSPEGAQERKQVLFLSRIHPKKGLALLLEAWANLAPRFPDWDLVIAGNNQNGYQETLEASASRMQIADRISFSGPIYGQEKHALLRNAELFVLPTYTENFGMVVAEALAHGTPAITTKGAPWENLERHRCGWWIEIGCQPLTNALNNAMRLSSLERAEMGRRGRSLIEERYSIQSVAERMIELYGWLVHGGAKPDFVRGD